jgi:transcription initiation factor TFIIIB Brf1 subunit/transcription initiation factor TFIIB
MATLSNRPIPLSKNKTRKNIKDIWNFYDDLKSDKSSSSETKESETKEGKTDATLKQQEKQKTKIQIVKPQNACCQNQSNLVISEDGFITCSVCAFTDTDIIDASAEWRFYGAEGNKGEADPTRCGMPSNNLFENNLTCTFQAGHSASYKKNISSLIRYTNSSNLTHKDKTLLGDIQQLTNLGLEANFTQCIIDNAITIHKQIITYLKESDVHFRSENRDSILFGDFDLACKRLNVPRTVKEFAALWSCDIQTVTAGCKIVQTVFAQIEQNTHDSQKITSKHTQASSFIDRFCSNLQIRSPAFSKLCTFILPKIKAINSMSQHTPQSVAAGTILFLANNTNMLPPNYITKDQLSRATGVSDVTIAKINTKLFEYHTNAHKLIPKKLFRPLEIKNA